MTTYSPVSRHRDWLVVGDGERLHRVQATDTIDTALSEAMAVEATAVCGTTGTFWMPGMFSRMGLERCPTCCDRLGVRRGRGNTLNADIDEPQVAA